MTTPYQKGYALELKVKAHLENLGYVVFRVAGSHGPADLIAMMPRELSDYPTGDTEVWFIQCQRSKYFSQDKKRELSMLASSLNAESTLAWSGDARKRGNNAVEFLDDAIIRFAPQPPRAAEVGK